MIHGRHLACAKETKRIKRKTPSLRSDQSLSMQIRKPKLSGFLTTYPAHSRKKKSLKNFLIALPLLIDENILNGLLLPNDKKQEKKESKELWSALKRNGKILLTDKCSKVNQRFLAV